MIKNLLILHCFCNVQFQNFSILLTWLSYFTTSKYCYQTSTWNIFELVIPLNFWGEKGRKYILILVTMVSDITVLVSQNVIFFRYFLYIFCLWAMISPKSLLQVPLSLLPQPTRFCPGLFVVLQ